MRFQLNVKRQQYELLFKYLGKLEDSHFYKLEYIKRRLNVVCRPCNSVKKKNKHMEAGSQGKAFSNSKAHIKTMSHNTQNSISFYNVGM